MKRKAVITRMEFDGIRYNVQIWTEVVPGDGFYYAGVGKYFKDLAGAVVYADSLADSVVMEA